MGVVDVRGERVQTAKEIETLGAAGAAIINPDRIAQNPDCGFAPDYAAPDVAGEPPVSLSLSANNLRW